jgi:hypothetical protein
MIISPNYPDEKALEMLLKKLGLSEEDFWEQLGNDWVLANRQNENMFFRIYKGEFDVAIVFSNCERIEVCPIEGSWESVAQLGYQPGKPVANMPFGEEWISELEEALEKAAIVRRSTYRVCKYCKDYLPPEHMVEPKLCQACASKHFGVVY